MDDELRDLIEALDRKLGTDEDLKGGTSGGYNGLDLCCGVSDLGWFLVLAKLKLILRLLKHPKFGLKEIKREIKEIEQNMCPTPPGPVTGPLSTGPFFVRTGENNAINVKVQNIGTEPIDATVTLWNIGVCPIQPVDSEVLLAIGDGCCAQDVVLTAPAGNFEVVICPDPADATIRAFVSVHSGNSANSAFEYVIKASEMLTPGCELCQQPG